ncbi:MAG TPA: hypothetical protein PK821_03035 [Victivallales bacterium]|nr:hypothetical protein [Victivallales bacterium]
MSNELREIQRKVREAAKKHEVSEKKKKEHVKQTSINVAMEDRKKLEEELKKKSHNHGIYFIAPVVVIALTFIGLMIWQIMTINSPSKEAWEKPKYNPDDISAAKEFISESLLAARNGKNPDDHIAERIPPTWKESIRTILSSTKDDTWAITDVTADSMKTGSNPVFRAMISNSNQRRQAEFIIVKEANRFMILKASKTGDDKNDEPEK